MSKEHFRNRAAHISEQMKSGKKNKRSLRVLAVFRETVWKAKQSTNHPNYNQKSFWLLQSFTSFPWHTLQSIHKKRTHSISKVNIYFGENRLHNLSSGK